jgi:hypothetical protein
MGAALWQETTPRAGHFLTKWTKTACKQVLPLR